MALKVVPLAHKIGLKGTLDLGKNHWEQEPCSLSCRDPGFYDRP